VPLAGGTFAGPELRGKLLPGASADWQTVLPDGTALGDQIEAAAAQLDWLNKGVFISVRRPPRRHRGLREIPR
jgi:Protein of unknown function (DUF3237)